MKMTDDSRKICVICEGHEEKEYFDKLVSLNLFSKNYIFSDTINAKSITNIFSRYQGRYQSNSYHLILILCDTDKLTDYNQLKKNISEFHNANVADDIIMFANPCTMQIILSHFLPVQLKSQSKKINAEHIKEAVSIENYDAHEKQRKILFSKINRKNYIIMKENLSLLNNKDDIKPSTNFLKFLNSFENDDSVWINEINSKL